MPDIDLKAYTTQIKEIESAIFTEKKLIEEQKEILISQFPKEPIKKEIIPPEYPKENKINYFYIPGNELIVIFISILLTILGVISIKAFKIWQYDSFTLPLWIGIGAGLIGIFMILYEFYEYFTSIREDIIKKNNNKRIKENFQYLMQNYYIELNKIENEYLNEIKKYEEENFNKLNRYNEIMKSHKIAISALEKKLKELYDENIIFPKYRNLVAITSINEYLLSGRCDKLEGPDGAYNLYELELRQNIIISQISAAIENLEAIRTNQFSLYEEIKNSNIIINEILLETQEMNKTIKLNTYLSGIIALAETSPKYYHGISY